MTEPATEAVRTTPQVGEMVCDCWYQHQQIAHVAADGDTVSLVDGLVCSYSMCCDPPNHQWEHPTHAGAEMPPEWEPRCVFAEGRPCKGPA